jgi:hypothetical protein
VPSTSLGNEQRCRFGLKRVRVFRFEWLTKLPNNGFLPDTAQTRDIENILLKAFQKALL